MSTLLVFESNRTGRVF